MRVSLCGMCVVKLGVATGVNDVVRITQGPARISASGIGKCEVRFVVYRMARLRIAEGEKVSKAVTVSALRDPRVSDHLDLL